MTQRSRNTAIKPGLTLGKTCSRFRSPLLCFGAGMPNGSRCGCLGQRKTANKFPKTKDAASGLFLRNEMFPGFSDSHRSRDWPLSSGAALCFKCRCPVRLPGVCVVLSF